MPWRGIALTTLLAGAAGGVFSTITVWLKTGVPDVAMAGNGVLGGLVAITAGHGQRLAVGSGDHRRSGRDPRGLLRVLHRRRGVDDPVGAVSVHGVCGAFGTLMVGLFATEGGLFYGDGLNQFVTQLIGVVAVFVFVVVTAGALFLAIKATIGLRVPAEEEIEGLDVVEHGAPGYGPDVAATASALA